MLTSFDYLKPGAQWPPRNDAERQKIARTNLDLYKGRFTRVWQEIEIDEKTVRVNWFRRISKFWAEALFSTPPVFENGIGDYYAPLMEVSEEAQVDLSRFGACVLLVRKVGVDVVLSSIRPNRWTPVVDPIDQTKRVGHVIAYPYSTKPESSVTPDRVLFYLVDGEGKTQRLIYRYDNLTLGSLESREALSDEFYVFPITNNVPSDDDVLNTFNVFDDNDYEDIKDSVREICLIYTRMSRTFKRFNDPHLYTDERVEVKPSVDGSPLVIPVPASDGQAPGYVVWDASLEAQFKKVENLQKHILQLTGLPDTLFLVTSSGQAVSGTSLSLRSIPMQLRIEKLRRTWEKSWSEILEALGQEAPTTTWPAIGFPNTMEQAETEKVRIESGTSSAEESKARLDRTE